MTFSMQTIQVKVVLYILIHRKKEKVESNIILVVSKDMICSVGANVLLFFVLKFYCFFL